MEPKIVIGMACTDIVRAKTANAIGCAIIGDPYIIDFITMQSCDIVSSRTWITQQAIEKGATHLFFVDSDMLFPHDTIRKLVAQDKDVIGCDYNKRKYPVESTVTLLPGTEKKTDESYKVAVAATGTMLINLRVFKEKEWTGPYFNFGRDKFGRHVLGEDAWFCYSVAELGYEVWVDPTIKVFHLGEFGY